MAVTMKDVAEAAGISRPTVSLILNGRGGALRIADATRQRVMETAQRLGYRRNELARAVKRGRTNVIAFVGGNGSYVMDILAGINLALQRRNYLLKMFILDVATDFRHVCRQCVEQMVAGVICRSLAPEQLELLRRELVPAGIPVVQVDNSFPHDWCGRVVSDDVTGGRLAVRHLLEQGHRRIGLVCTDRTPGYVVLRRQGYLEELAAAGIAPDPELEIGIGYDLEWTDTQRRMVDDLLCRKQPDAVFCVSDPLALKTLFCARMAGLDVPRDLSVVGYANLDYASFSSPPLTTVAQPFPAMGETAADALVNALEAAAGTSSINLKVPVRLVVRQSTAPRRARSSI